MSFSAHELLHETLSRRLPDGARSAVLVVGAGLQHHLRAHAGAAGEDPEWRAFCDWNGLLASVAEDFDLPQVLHLDPTATWEGLVTRRALAVNRPAHDAEEAALAALCHRLRSPPADASLLARFGAALRSASYRDVLSLNFDGTLDLAWAGHPVDPEVTTSDRHERRVAVVSCLERGPAWARHWYPHGHVGDPSSVQLGQRAYGMTVGALERSRERFKQVERAWRTAHGVTAWTADAHAAWEVDRRARAPVAADPSEPRLTWMDLFLLSDLVFVGCSLDRAEVDLWWALHQRARNVARVRPTERPRTLVIGTRETFKGNPHLATGVAGVTPVMFEAWDDAWAVLLGRWWR